MLLLFVWHTPVQGKRTHRRHAHRPFFVMKDFETSRSGVSTNESQSEDEVVTANFNEDQVHIHNSTLVEKSSNRSESKRASVSAGQRHTRNAPVQNQLTQQADGRKEKQRHLGVASENGTSKNSLPEAAFIETTGAKLSMREMNSSSDIFIYIFLAVCVLLLAAFARKVKVNYRAYFGIGQFLRKVGYDDFDTFTLSVLVDSVEYLGAEKYALKISCGQNSSQTSFVKESREIHETLEIRILQGSGRLLVSMVNIKGKPLASKSLTIKEVQKLSRHNKRTVLTLNKCDKHMTSDVKANVTFFVQSANDSGDEADSMFAGCDTTNFSPEMQLLLKSTASNSRQGKDDSTTEQENVDAKATTEESPLELLAAACKGTVKLCGSMGHVKDYYMAVYKADKDGNPKDYVAGTTADLLAWHFGWWQDEASFMRKEPPVGSIAMLRITNVHAVPEKQKKDNFCIRHVNKNKQKEDLFFKKVDRSREVWVECLHLFLEQLWKLRKEVTVEKGQKKSLHSKSVHSKSVRGVAQQGGSSSADSGPANTDDDR